MQQLDAGEFRRHGQRDVLARALAGRGVGDRLRVGARERDQLLQILVGQILARHERVGPGDRETNGYEILERIVVELGIEPGIERDVGERAEQQRVAVGRRLGRCFRSDQRAGTDAVLHHQRLSEQGRQPIGQDARHGIEPAAGRLRYDDLDGVIGIGLGGGRSKADPHACSQQRNPKQEHVFSSWPVHVHAGLP